MTLMDSESNAFKTVNYLHVTTIKHQTKRIVPALSFTQRAVFSANVTHCQLSAAFKIKSTF